MKRVNWYFRQRVTNQEMTQFEDFIELSDLQNFTEVLGDGIITGGQVTENTAPDNQNVLVGITLARDSFGNRTNINNFFADTVSAVVRGLTLANDGIGVPSTVGTYILFNSKPGISPFTLVGQPLKISRSTEGNNGTYEIKQVVTTTWGGLIPSQVMVRIDEEINEDGYESNLSPRGTTSLSEISSAEPALANVAFDELNQDIRPVNPGTEKYVSLYARFDRFEFDQRLDGNANTIDFLSFESFKFVVDASQPEALIGAALLPDIRTNGDIFIADIRLENGANVLNADISTVRQKFMANLPEVAKKLFEYANLRVFGSKITWSGANLSTVAAIQITLPNVANFHTIDPFNIAIADGEVLYFIIDRTNAASQTLALQKVARGGVPEGNKDELVVVFAERLGTKLQGAYGGELEAGESRDIGDSIGDAYLSFTGMSSENDGAPTYVNPRLVAATSLEAADDELADDLDELADSLGDAVENSNQDRNAKMVKGGVYGPTTFSAPNLTLPFSQDIYIQVPGVPEVRNRIPAGSFVFDADGKVAYVSLNRVGVTPADLAIQYSLIENIDPLDNDILILARRNGTDVLVGQTFNLKLGELLELDGALAEINKYFGQLKLFPHETDATKVRISGADIQLLDGRILTQELRNLIMAFNGAVIRFTTGEIFADDDITPLGLNFTPFAIPNDEYSWYGVGIVPSTVALDNTIGVQVFVTPTEESDLDADLAPKPVIAGTKKLGAVRMFNDFNGGAGAGLVISTIRQLGTGSGSGSGEGDASTILSRMEDELDESFYRFLEPNIFSISAEEKVDSTDADFSIVDSLYEFEAAQFLQSIELLDPDFENELNDVLQALVILVFDQTSVDPAPVVELANNGVDFQEVTMDRLSPSSDTFVGELVFDLLTLILQTLHEYAYANEDDAIVLQDVGVIQTSQEFDVAEGEVLEKIGLRIVKTGAPVGFLKVNLHEDNAGEPGIVKYQALYNIEDLIAGSQTLEIVIGRQVLKSGLKYHFSVETDSDYKANYDAGVDEIAVGSDSSAPSIALAKSYNGSIWANIAGNSIVYKLEGRVLSLLLKYTASAVAKLKGYGVLYGHEAESFARLSKRAAFSFDAQTNLQNEFQLPWNADPDFLEVIDRVTGQTWGVPAFELENNKIIFPVDFFDGREIVYLVAKQVEAGSFDANPELKKLAAENYLGSGDPQIDRSVAGLATKSRASDNVLVMITVDADRNLIIKEG